MKTFVILTAAAVALLSNVVTGEDLVCTGSCVKRWKKCAGEGIAAGTLRPCCNDDDHCVRKSSGFSQCRPKSRDIPASWSGAILTCTDPPECDPTAFSAHLSGLSANLKVENAPIELDFFYGDYIDGEAGCLEKCQENPECFAFDITCDADCTLFGKNLFSTAATLQPYFDSEIFLTRCFLPEPLCDPATREVRKINPLITPNNPSGFHQMAADSDERDFSVTPESYTLTAAINACRLTRDLLGGCIGFAIDAEYYGDVTLLYKQGPGTRNYRSDLLDEKPEVYSIEACL